MTWNEQRTNVPAQLKIARKERRKERQRANKRKSFQGEEADDDDDGEETWQAYNRRSQRDYGYGYSSAASSQWRPKCW